MVKLIKFSCVFLVVKPFLWYQGQHHLSRVRSNINFSKNVNFGSSLISQTHLVLLHCSITEFWDIRIKTTANKQVGGNLVISSCFKLAYAQNAEGEVLILVCVRGL